MNLIWDDRAEWWVADRIKGCARGFGECRSAFVIDKQGRPVAGIVLHDWSPEFGIVEVSAAADDPRWLTREIARAVFGYIFAFAQMTVIRTAPSNRRVRKMWRSFGAEEYVIPRLRGRDEAGVLMTLTDDQWAQSRWNRGKTHGQAEGSEAA